jgi:prepilin-type N-terminal cleavage/methylation domain-containing protein
MPKVSRGTSFDQRGFTLIELLIVLAILGILGGMTLWIYIRESRLSYVRQAAFELQADIENLRTSAIRLNGSAIFERLSNTQVRFTLPGAAPRTESLPPGVSIQLGTGSNNSFTYQAPLATITTGSNVYEISLANAPSVFVKVIGVTGKVVLSATSN